MLCALGQPVVNWTAEEALAVRKRAGRHFDVGGTLADLAGGAISRGDHAEATARLNESLALRRELGDKHMEAWTLLKLADSAFARGDLDDALGHLEGCEVLNRDMGEPVSPWVLSSRGDIALRRGDYIGRARNRIFGMAGLARVARERGDFDDARRRYDEVIAAAKGLREDHHAAVWTADAAINEARAGNLDRARELATEAVAVARGPRTRSDALRAAVTVAIASGDLEGAGAHLSEALATVRDVPERPRLVTLFSALAELRLAEGKPSDAVRMLGVAQGLRDTWARSSNPSIARDTTRWCSARRTGSRRRRSGRRSTAGARSRSPRRSPRRWVKDRKSTRLNSSHLKLSRMPSSA